MPCDRPSVEARYEQVVARASRGEQAAIDELVEVLRPRLTSYCRPLLQDPDQTSQVVEETVGDIVAALPGMSERRAPFPSWAYGLAARRVRWADGHDDAGRTRDLLELTSQEHAVLDGLERGATMAEIARSAYLSVGTVEVMYRRALQKVRGRRLGQRGRVAMLLRGERLREQAAAGPVRHEGVDDRADEGGLDLAAAREALIADVRAAARDHEPPTFMEAAERAAFAEPEPRSEPGVEPGRGH